jgi:hypothetical protein
LEIYYTRGQKNQWSINSYFTLHFPIPDFSQIHLYLREQGGTI